MNGTYWKAENTQQDIRIQGPLAFDPANRGQTSVLDGCVNRDGSFSGTVGGVNKVCHPSAGRFRRLSAGMLGVERRQEGPALAVGHPGNQQEAIVRRLGDRAYPPGVDEGFQAFAPGTDGQEQRGPPREVVERPCEAELAARAVDGKGF